MVGWSGQTRGADLGCDPSCCGWSLETDQDQEKGLALGSLPLEDLEWTSLSPGE